MKQNISEQNKTERNENEKIKINKQNYKFQCTVRKLQKAFGSCCSLVHIELGNISEQNKTEHKPNELK